MFINEFNLFSKKSFSTLWLILNSYLSVTKDKHGASTSFSPVMNDKGKYQDGISSRKRAFDVSSINIDKLLNESSLKSSDGCIKILENLNISSDCIESG